MVRSSNRHLDSHSRSPHSSNTNLTTRPNTRDSTCSVHLYHPAPPPAGHGHVILAHAAAADGQGRGWGGVGQADHVATSTAGGAVWTREGDLASHHIITSLG